MDDWKTLAQLVGTLVAVLGIFKGLEWKLQSKPQKQKSIAEAEKAEADALGSEIANQEKVWSLYKNALGRVGELEVQLAACEAGHREERARLEWELARAEEERVRLQLEVRSRDGLIEDQRQALAAMREQRIR